MAFNEKQLETWANQGATTTSANTYNSIKTCIESHNWNDDVNFDIYLQGSYKNYTNIRGDSDVDVVVEFTSVFYSNKHTLPKEQLSEFDEYYSDGKYSLESVKQAIIKKLKEYYGDKYVEVGNKSIKVLANNGRLDCDVVCCATYKEYNSFSRVKTDDYVKGIVFWTDKTNEKVVNFPIKHYDNGVTKNRNCDTNYKSTIRVIKNMKSRMVENKRITNTLAPSYYIECLMFNIPDAYYKNTTYGKRIFSILTKFRAYTDAELEKFVCQNWQRYLFGSSDQQWNLNECKEFINELIKFWDEG